MNVSDQFEKVRVFLANDRFVTALKNMSGLAMPFIKILAVGLLQPLHEFRQWLFGAFNEQMDMVGHQAVGVQHIVIFLTVPCQPFDIALIVAFRSKGLLPLVASHNNVIQNPRGEYSGTTRRDATPYQDLPR